MRPPWWWRQALNAKKTMWMPSALERRLQSLRFGEVQACENIAVVPLLSPEEGKCSYLTLTEALASWNIAVTEVSAGGSMPELLVVNRGDTPVLLIDGEELSGAKKNRVLNTSILLKGCSETKLPVSCTEQGRWSYTSRACQESGNVMAHSLRARKARSVSASLAESASFLSDQREVWDSIAELQSKACAPSPTSAMSDVFKAGEDDLLQCAQTFQLCPTKSASWLSWTAKRRASSSCPSVRPTPNSIPS